MIVNIEADGSNRAEFKKDQIEIVNMPRIGESIILPKLGYWRIKDIEHDYTQEPVVTTLILR